MIQVNEFPCAVNKTFHLLKGAKTVAHLISSSSGTSKKALNLIKMSTFSGIMPEMDFISIDRFEEKNLNSRAFFLSHCHKDHMTGLGTREFECALLQNNAYLYMSHVSKSIIEKMHPYLVTRIRALDTFGKNFIDIPDIDKTITVTLIPAGHCPGSVMFLFESDKTLLYTGDIRIRVNELQKYKQLYDSTGKLKQIYNIYLDTTFFNKSYQHFPLREQSINEFCNVVNNWLNKDIKNHVSVITPAKYGSEYLFLEIYRKIKMPIHVDDEKYNLYKCFPEMDKAITLNDKKTRIHNYCLGWNTANKICISLLDSINILNIKPSAQIWKNLKTQDCIIKHSNCHISVCYSSHSSYNEIVDILKFLKPLNITPCVVPKNDKDLNKLIKNILEEIHKTDISDSDTSDEEFDINWTKQNIELHEDNASENMDCFNILDSPELKKKL